MTLTKKEMDTSVKPSEVLRLLREEKEKDQDILSQLQKAKNNSIETLNPPKTNSKQEIITSVKPSEVLKIKGEKKRTEQDILSQLQKAKEDTIATLKIAKKDLKTNLIEHYDKINQISLKDLENNKENAIYLGFFGNFVPIDPEIINKFKIDTKSLINSRVNNSAFMDLENLFYFISILKMLNLDIPFTTNEALGFLNNNVNGNIFSSSRDKIPDIKSIFYGLMIYYELNLSNNTENIDFSKIEKFIKLNLKNFIPEKLELNLYSLLCLKLMEKYHLKGEDINISLNPILNLKISNLKDYSPIQDIYNHLIIIRLLDNEANIKRFQKAYSNEIKKLSSSIGSINNIITESAKALLIIDLLNLKEEETELCSNLLNYITKSTTFFNLTNLNNGFNWQNNQLGYKIELKMLFWALLAILRYDPNLDVHLS